MQLLYKFPTTVERDALINALSESGISAVSPEQFDVTAISYGGFPPVNAKYTVFAR